MPSRYRDATAQEVRDWARSEGYDVGDRGRFSTEIVSEFNQAHKGQYLRYTGGTGQAAAPAQRQTGNSRSTQTNARTTSRSSNSQQTRRAPARQTERATAPAPSRQTTRRAPQRDGVTTAVMAPAGTGLTEEQEQSYGRMLADMNAVTGYTNELTIIRIAPAQVA